MIVKRGLLAALAGAGLVLQACSSPPPPPPPVVQAPPPPPDYSGTYAGTVTWPKGCHGPRTATLTVAGTTYTLPWGKTTSFTGPVGPDGAFAGEIMASPPPSKKHKAPERQAIDLTGKITPPSATGQVTLAKCVGTLNLTKSG